MLDDREHLGQDLAVARDRRERALVAVQLNLRLRVEGRQPDDFAVAAFDLRHPFDGRRVHAADREIERDAAEHLDARHGLAHDERERGRGLVVVLDDDRAHPGGPSRPREIECVELARRAVGRRVRVHVDGAVERLRAARSERR